MHMCFLPLLRDLTQTVAYSWGGVVLAHTDQELFRVSLDRRCGISGCITDESNSHIILSPFFTYILRLSVQNNVKLWSLHPKLCFARIWRK